MRRPGNSPASCPFLCFGTILAICPSTLHYSGDPSSTRPMSPAEGSWAFRDPLPFVVILVLFWSFSQITLPCFRLLIQNYQRFYRIRKKPLAFFWQNRQKWQKCRYFSPENTRFSRISIILSTVLGISPGKQPGISSFAQSVNNSRFGHFCSFLLEVPL